MVTRYRLVLVEDGGFPVDPALDPPSSKALLAFLFDLTAEWDREHLGVVMMTARKRVLGYHVAYVGTSGRCPWEASGLLVPALVASAKQVVIFHNHPNGDARPSWDDFCFTDHMENACGWVGLELVDHLILGKRPNYYSLRGRLTW